MNSDQSRHVPDVAFRQAGVGLYMTFACARCGKVKPVVGRKMQRVRGLRTFVCAGCAK